MLNQNRQPDFTVFVSYSHDSEEHINRARSLADSLCGYGISVIYDGYEIAPKEGWPKWMVNSLEKSKFALIVCSRGYYNKFKGVESSGKGVKFESLISLQELFDNNSENSKYIPVFFSRADEKYIPHPLRGFQYYCLEHNSGFEELYRHLTEQPKVTKPKIGDVLKMDDGKRRNDRLYSLEDAQNQTGTVTSHQTFNATKTDNNIATIEMHLDRRFEDFNSHQQEQFLKSLASLLNIDNTEIRIKKVEKGSVKVTFEIPQGSLKELLELRKHKFNGYEDVVENEKIKLILTNSEAEPIAAIESDVADEEKTTRRARSGVGTVKWFNNAKGFGFIVPEEGGEDIFAHYSTIQMEGYRSLKSGQEVTFDINEGPKGRHADNIGYSPKKGEI